MALFCHGGVWAHGERWHYAPMATRLAQAGVLTMIISYSLYPKASAAMQAAEVNQALSWSLSNADKYGGDPAKVSSLRLNCPSTVAASLTAYDMSYSGTITWCVFIALQVSLIGHSAGAHLCAMALLHRAALAGKQLTQQNNQQPVNLRMPAAFVGIAGVYDISQHFDYERTRGVEVCASPGPCPASVRTSDACTASSRWQAVIVYTWVGWQELSTMKRAMGGAGGFAAQSPTVLVARALAAVSTPSKRTDGVAELPRRGLCLRNSCSRTAITCVTHADHNSATVQYVHTGTGSPLFLAKPCRGGSALRGRLARCTWPLCWLRREMATMMLGSQG